MSGKPSTPALEGAADIVTRFELVKHDPQLGKPLAP